MEAKYRIVELNGKFSIEVYTKIINDYWLFEKSRWEWRPTDIDGDPFHVIGGFIIGAMFIPHKSKTFSTLEDAKEQVKKWQAKPKYHEV
jgi:hypothetical protein